ncbi:MAG: ABC transporter substrate-binding protein, partial [Flavobacteriaceae bacterium]
MNSLASSKKIISLVPSQTELLVDLGLENQIVGITKFCIHPNHLKKEKTIVGGTKNIKIEKIKNLKPDIILCNKEENTKEIVEACQQIALTHVSELYTLKDTKKLIYEYGDFFNCKSNSQQIIKELNSLENDFLKFIKNKEKLKVAYFIWKKPWMVAANNTFVNHILELNKFDNVFKNLKRYPEITIQELTNKKDLDLILLSSKPYPFKEKDAIELEKITKT